MVQVAPTVQSSEERISNVTWQISVCLAPRSINDILISGPTNISKHRNTHGEFVIRWTPIQDDLGQHFPICFTVESILG